MEQNQGNAEEPQQKKGKGKSGKRFEIKKWNAVAMWSWAICTDTCAICRNNLYEPSIEYQANPTGTWDSWSRQLVFDVSARPSVCQRL